MTTIINAVTSTGLTQTADGSGVLKVQSNGVTTNALAWGSYAAAVSAAPTLRSAYNISSITRNSAGNYTIAFTTTQTDANYAVVGIATYSATQSNIMSVFSKTSTNFVLQTAYVTGLAGQTTNFDYGIDFVIFGN